MKTILQPAVLLQNLEYSFFRSAHWFSQNERSFKMSVWNTSHTIGSGSLGLLVTAGIAIFAMLGWGDTWRAAFIFPSCVALLLAVFCWWAQIGRAHV